MSAQPTSPRPAPAELSADDPHEIGGYRLRARLGAGGMGVVYLAHTPGGRPIALKAVRAEYAADPEFRERFAREVASARRIHGLFTAQVVDHGVAARTPWLATAYVPGPSLHEVVQRHGPLPVRTVLLLVAGIAEALQAIHAAGVVHRDLKPANVLLAGDGPRVIDFGIAHAADSVALTGTGLRIGTAAFMAPEQALGHPVTPATDVFALGALTAYLSGGAPPFGGGPESGALYRVVHEAPDLSRLPPELSGLVARCLAKEPAARPGAADLIAYVRAHPAVGPRAGFDGDWLPRAVRAELDRPAAPAPAGPAAHPPTLLATPGPAAPARVPAPASGRRAVRRRRLPAVLLAVAVALAAGGAVAYCLDLVPGGGGAQEPDTGPGPAAASYRPAGAPVELTAPDDGYEFDLAAGRVVPADTASWYLAPDGRSLVPSDESDSFVADGPELSVAGCLHGIETRPAAGLPLDELGGDRAFCVRSPDRRGIAVVRLVPANGSPGPVAIELERYRAD
ncbi:serine/threonine-protein kinase [Streptomyces sp. NPDC089919]|uniref:serine/threonine-protein kinase n=1 Tax=Streptomyces sp. NPDC089919 TaxID=3155188 RepID=UPI00343E9603